MKVAIYARVSKAEADAENDARQSSIPVQLADCHERAEAEGWTIVDEYVDEGVSAWNPRRKRPEYERMLADIEAGVVDAILVRETERLLRQQKDSISLADLADAGHLKLIASTMESDTNFRRARDRKEFRDRASSAEFYSDYLSEKIKRTKQRQLASGEYTGGEANPFGYRRVATGRKEPSTRLEVDPKEAALLHDAVRQLHQGDSLYRITAEWNDQGVQTSRGAKWRPKTLRRTLLSEHLVGARGYPPIFTDTEAAIAHTVLEREPVAPVGRPVGRKYPLTGLVVCSECGEKMSAWSGQYRCDRSKGGCGAVSVHAFWLEQYVLDELAQLPEIPAVAPEVREIDTEPLLSELQEIKASIAETQALASDGKLRPSDSAPILDGLRERERAVTDELAHTLLDAEPRTKTIEVLHPFFPPHPLASILPFGLYSGETADVIERWSRHKLTETEVLQLRDEYFAYVDRVTVRKSAQRGKSFDSKRIRIGWKRARKTGGAQ